MLQTCQGILVDCSLPSSSDRRESIDHIRSLPENPPNFLWESWEFLFFPYLYPYKPGTKTKSRLPASQIPNPCLNCSLSLSKSKETKSDGKNIQLSIKDPFFALAFAQVWKETDESSGWAYNVENHFMHSPYSLLFKLFLSKISTSKSLFTLQPCSLS